MQGYACALTSMAMALDYLGVSTIKEATGLQPFTPLELNEFMSNTLNLSAPGGLFSGIADVDFVNTPKYIAANVG